MKDLAVYPITVFLIFVATFAQAQFSVAITVNDGSATTTCTDIVGNADPMWSINIENQGWVNYPSFGPCYTDFPNLQFQQNYTCLSDIPPTLQVCFRAFENDAGFFTPCDEVTACLVETCMDIPIPPFGAVDFTIALPDGMDSDGEANLTIESTGIPGGVNDLPCQAIDIGILENEASIGSGDTIIFNNFCSTNIGEPNPWQINMGIVNHQGVWFKFTSNSDPGSHILIETVSDPANFGDPIDTEIAVFTSDGDCNGPFNLISSSWDGTDYNESETIVCIEPNTDYYIMVDGKVLTLEGKEGYFGLQITEMGVEAMGDFICDAMDLGAVPLGGSLSNTGLISNACATGTNDPPAATFSSQAGVWFTFEAPPTGHIEIEAISNDLLDQIELQIGIYQSDDGTCDGNLNLVASRHTPSDNNEYLEVSCLNPGETYYMLIDGAQISDLLVGIFDITVSDAGNETITFNQTVTLCAGETLPVGNEVYGVTGNYVDTLELPSGCDSIVITDLVVLEELVLNFDITNIGLNLGNTNGTAIVNPSGGAGGYTTMWSDGQTTEAATGLIGGDNYCVEVTDANGCQVDTCFEMPYYENFITAFTVDTLDCFGDSDADILFTAELGVPPYLFSWQNSSSTLSGSGAITVDGQMIALENLPADIYTINISDINYDTTLTLEVVQPDLISIDNPVLTNASCFSECDGSIQVNISGGVPPYQLIWSNGSTNGMLSNLCASIYDLTVTDDNGCTALFNYQIDEPMEFIATAESVQAVSCFQGNDGQATVTTNGTPVGFLWSNGENTETVEDLLGGIYEVTVTNLDGCTATSSIEIVTPQTPVTISIQENESIVCFGENSGELQGLISGPGTDFTYVWNNGETSATANGLTAGSYSVTVSNELGCTANDSYLLSEPSEITLDFTTNSLTCNDPIDGGIVSVSSISGGLDPYLFSVNGAVFNEGPEVPGFMAGQSTLFVQDALGCIREFNVSIDGPQEILLNLGDSKTIDLGDYVQLSSQSNILDLEYQWSPVEGLSCPNCPETEAQPTESTLYTLTVIDQYDCTATAEVAVEVVKKRKVYVPNAFSPNGDGINDEFAPFVGPDVVEVIDFKIFDRQGNMVFEAGNFLPGDLSNAWNGSFKGQMMQPAVFVWFAQVQFLDGATEVYEGDVTLIR